MTDIAPGEPAPKTGTYHLVDRYGTPTGTYGRFHEGQSLSPNFGVNGYAWPLFYRLIGDDAVDAA